MSTSRWLSVSQAARLLDVSAQTVRNLEAAGKLESERSPYGRLFDVAAVQRLAVERTAKRAKRL